MASDPDHLAAATTLIASYERKRVRRATLRAPSKKRPSG